MSKINDWWNNLKKKVGDFFTGIKNWGKDTIDAYTGKSAVENAKENTELAKQTEEWNESFHEKELTQAQEQFEKTQELAQSNLDYQKEYAEKNYQLQENAFLEQQKENALMREREDTSFQRQVEDLKAAGLSPLAVSGGAASQGATVGSAPQYDMSGVSTAQGSMINLAQQYAALRNEAMGNYANRKLSARNAQIAAKQVLGEVALQRRAQGIQFASQLFNARMAQKEFNLKSRQVDEQIAASKQQREWYKNNGYRNDKLWTLITPILQDLAGSIKVDYDKLKEAFSAITGGNIQIQMADLRDLYDGSENGFNELKNKTEVLKGAKISKSSFDDLIAQLTEDFNPSSETVTDWYNAMNDDFQKRWTYKDFYKAVKHQNNFMRSSLLKWLLFGNSGNI